MCKYDDVEITYERQMLGRTLKTTEVYMGSPAYVVLFHVASVSSMCVVSEACIKELLPSLWFN